jgi:Na+/phosphate symporter
MALHLAGGLGLVLLGGWIATEAFRCIAFRLWSEVLGTGRRSPIRAFRSGLCTALVLPASTPLTRGAIAASEGSTLGVAGALLFACGLSFGVLVSATWAVFAVASSFSAEMAGAMIGCGALARTFARAPRWSKGGEVLAGTGLALFGMVELGRACAELGAVTRLDAWNLGLIPRTGMLVIAGACVAAWLRSPSVVAASALCAVHGGALQVPSGAALALGAYAAFAAPAIRALGTSNADGRRVALGLLLHHALCLVAGLLALPWLLPLASKGDALGWARPLGMLACLGISVGVGTLVLTSLARPFAAVLDHFFVEQETGVGRGGGLPPELAIFPSMALESGLERVRQLLFLVRLLARTVLSGAAHTSTRRKSERESIAELSKSLEEAFAAMNGRTLPTFLSSRLPALRRAVHALQALADQLAALYDQGTATLAELAQPVAMRFRQLDMLTLHLIEGCNPVRDPSEASTLPDEFENVRRHGHDLFQRSVEAHQAQRPSAQQALWMLDRLNLLEAVGRRTLEADGDWEPTASATASTPAPRATNAAVA